MKNLLIILIFIAMRLNAFSFTHGPIAFTLQLKGKESKVHVVMNGRKIEITFDYAQKNRNIIIQAESSNELNRQLKAKKPKEYSTEEMEELCIWIEEQLKRKEVNSVGFSTLSAENLKGSIQKIEITRYTMDQIKNELSQATKFSS